MTVIFVCLIFCVLTIGLVACVIWAPGVPVGGIIGKPLEEHTIEPEEEPVPATAPITVPEQPVLHPSDR